MIGRARSQPDLGQVELPPLPSTPPPNRPPPPIPNGSAQQPPDRPPPPIPNQPQAPDVMAPVRQAVAAAKPIFDSAERILATNPLPTALTAFAQTYQTVSGDLTTALQGTDPNLGTTALNAKHDAANRIMLVNGRIQAVNRRRAQIQKQQQTFDEFSAISQDVKRSTLRPGGADNIEKEKLKGGTLFQAYIDKMREAEQARANIDPKAVTDENTARDIKAKCEAMMAAAQAYIAHFNSDYSDRQKKDKTNLRKKQLCEEGLLSARQFALAMEMDSLGRPDQNNPWDEQKELRASSAKAAVYFESSYQQARTLKADNTGGASDSYWLKSAKPKEGFDERGRQTVTMVADKREAIFKPSAGERVPDYMSDTQGAGTIKEMLAGTVGKLLASQTGIDLQAPETTVTSISPHALQGQDPNGQPVIGSMQMHAGVSDAVEDQPEDFLDKVKPKEAQKLAIFDIMVMNCDRHGGNILFDGADPENPRLVPIDNAASMPKRADFKKASRYFAGMTQNSTGTANVQNALLGMPSAYEPFDPETIAQLQLMDPDAMANGLKQQRDTAGQLNPGFQAQDLVPDECIDMTKRRMMFLKRAAKSLSPAEVQLAISVHGDRLFDATDNDFDDVADAVIAEMLPMRDAYKEIMLAPDDLQSKIVKTLMDNQWGELNNIGSLESASLLMKDPVSALKLFKSKKVNPNPPVLDTSPPDETPPDDAALPNAQQIEAMKAAFGYTDQDIAGSNEQQLKRALVRLNRFNAEGGSQEYDHAMNALGAKRDSHARFMPSTLEKWNKIKTLVQDVTTLPKYPGVEVGTATTSALADLLNRSAPGDMKNTADTVDMDQASDTSAQELIAEARRIAEMLTDATTRQGFEGQIGQAETKRTSGDAKGADKDAYALVRELTKKALAQAQSEAKDIEARLAQMTLNDNSKALAVGYVGNVLKSSRLDACFEALVTLRGFEERNRGRQAPDINLPAFTWSQDSASSVKSQATKAKFIPNKDTGMTAALSKVNKARGKIGAQNDDLPPNNASGRAKMQQLRATRKMLQDGIQAYNEFSVFVTGKLRGVSKEKQWLDYCNSAQTLTDQEIGALQARLKTVNETLPQGETTTLPG